MTLRTDLLPVFDSARGLIDSLGMRPNTLTVEVRRWPGRPGVAGTTPTVESSVEISPPPKIRQLSTREIAGSGGAFEDGDLRAEKITPAYTGSTSGGYTKEQIAPDEDPALDKTNVEVVYIVTGPNAGEYERERLDVDRNFGYALVLRRRRTTP